MERGFSAGVYLCSTISARADGTFVSEGSASPLLAKIGVAALIVLVAFGLLVALGPGIGGVELGIGLVLVVIAPAVAFNLVDRAGERRRR